MVLSKEGRKRLEREVMIASLQGLMFQTCGLPGWGTVRRVSLPCLRGEIGCGKIIKFLAHIEICYVSSIIVNKEMVISWRVLLGTAAFFFKYSWPPVWYFPTGIFPGMGTDNLGFSPWGPPSSVCGLSNSGAFVGFCSSHIRHPFSWEVTSAAHLSLLWVPSWT